MCGTTGQVPIAGDHPTLPESGISCCRQLGCQLLIIIQPSSLGGLPRGSSGKETNCNAGDPGSIPGSGRSPGEGIGYPLQDSWASLVAQLVKKSESEVAQSCPTLRDPMDYTVHVILQARTPELVAVPSSRGSSRPRDRTQVSHIAGRVFTSSATREAQESWSG